MYLFEPLSPAVENQIWQQISVLLSISQEPYDGMHS